MYLCSAVVLQCKFQYREVVSYIKIKIKYVPFLDVSTDARWTNCRGWMDAGYQVKGDIVFYLLTKYLSIFKSRLAEWLLWLNSCHMGMCWHDRARILPNIDVFKNAICPICRGWMAAGYQMKGNTVLHQLTKYLSILTSLLSAMCLWLNSCHMGMCWHDCTRIHPNIDVSKNATCPIFRGWIVVRY